MQAMFGVRVAASSLALLTCLSVLADEQLGSPQSTAVSSPDSELRRRGVFGAQFGAVTKEERERQKIEGEEGVLIERVFPETAAAEADFRSKDVILAVNGVRAIGVPKVLESLGQLRAGEEVVFAFSREGVQGEKRVSLKEMPRERGEGYEVIYGSVRSHGVRLRTIITRPKGEGRHSAVMLLQGGIACFSVDNPAGEPFGFTRIAQGLAKQGYVTLRIERPGCGDSEGGPLSDVDFDTELDGYKDALRALKAIDFVDADNVFLFGHSMGGIMAPLVANEVPVRGIAVYGTTPETWFESVFGQRRRLASMEGMDAAKVDEKMRDEARFWYPFLIEKKTPREIREQRAELPSEQWVADDKYVGGRHYKFWHQLADKNLGEAWAKVGATNLSVDDKTPAPGGPIRPRVLAIWGSSDWMSTRAPHAWIAEVVNRVAPGNGTFVAIDSIDHFFFRVATPEMSYNIFKPAGNPPAAQFNPAIIEAIHSWIKETTGGKTKSAETGAAAVNELME